jgi:hypothetical protein
MCYATWRAAWQVATSSWQRLCPALGGCFPHSPPPPTHTHCPPPPNEPHLLPQRQKEARKQVRVLGSTPCRQAHAVGAARPRAAAQAPKPRLLVCVCVL